MTEQEDKTWIDLDVSPVVGPLTVTVEKTKYRVRLPLSELPRLIRMNVEKAAGSVHLVLSYSDEEAAGAPIELSNHAKVRLGVFSKKLMQLQIDLDGHGADDARIVSEYALLDQAQAAIQFLQGQAVSIAARANYRAARQAFESSLEPLIRKYRELMTSAPTSQDD